jgi:hypothetical protein
MPLNPAEDKVQIYNEVTKRQRLANVSDITGTPVTPVTPYLGVTTDPLAVVTGTPLTLVFTPPFVARDANTAGLNPGFYNVVFLLTGTITHTVADPNDRYGAKLRAVVTVGASSTTTNAPVVFTGEDFTISATRGFQIADTESITVELLSDVDGEITITQCYLQAAYLYA